MQAVKSHCKCKSKSHARIEKIDFPFFSGLLIALLPKCPFRLLAYTRAISVCTVIITGTVLILNRELYTRLLGPYYWGCALLLLGVWIDGSFHYFLAILLSRMKKGGPRLHYHGQH